MHISKSRQNQNMGMQKYYGSSLYIFSYGHGVVSQVIMFIKFSCIIESKTVYKLFAFLAYFLKISFTDGRKVVFLGAVNLF